MPMQYWTIDPPKQWRLGFVGSDPFFADCADCGAKEPPIAGIASTDGTFAGIGIIHTVGQEPFVKPAMFCAACFAKRIGKVA